MKFNDDITLDIAKAVSDVLEGKVKKEEMDPTDHVKKSDEGKFCVYNAANKKVAEFDTKDEADKYAVDNHDKLMAAKNEVAEPRAKGEKDFKAKHTIKKVGVKADLDGTVITKEEVTESNVWAKMDDRAKDQLRDKYQKLGAMHDKLQKAHDFEYNDIDGDEDKADEIMDKMEKIQQAKQDMVKKYGRGVIKAKGFRQKKEAAEKTPTGPTEEETEKQKKYQAFFQKALKKFGVKSPAELEGDKKKEFFDYVDANYEADDEPKESVKEGAEQQDEVLGFVKKIAKKITGKDKPQAKSGAKGDGSDDPAQQLMDKIDKHKEKLKKTREKLKKAQGPDGDDDSEDYWGGVEMKQTTELEELEAKLKKIMSEK